MDAKNLDTHSVTCGNGDLEWLAMRCGRMARAINMLGPISREAYTNPFHALLHAVAGQQISGRAHASIWQRVLGEIKPLNPARLQATDPEELRRCGLSGKKAEYMIAIARAFDSGSLDSRKLAKMPDSELEKTLTSLPGVGPWTVEMIQIFTFRRKDILSYGDLGIRTGLCRLHKLEKMDRETFKYFKSLYSPCGSAASLYLWEIASKKFWPPTPCAT